MALLRDFLGVGARVPAPHMPQGASLRRRRPVRPARRRGWDPADQSSKFGDWSISNASGDEEVRARLELERGRSRETERTIPWSVRYYQLFEINVFGPEGLKLVPRVMRREARAGGVPDREANEAIRTGWATWSKKGNCTVDGRLSFAATQRKAGVAWKRDGEIFIRKYRGGRFGPHGFQVQLVESDHCPVNLCRDLQNGNRIHMGIERDPLDRPVAYWLCPIHPGDYRFGRNGLTDAVRIPANEIIHLYDPRRVGQSRGLPQIEAGLASLHMMGGYEEAELVAARVGASKMGWILSEDGTPYDGTGDDVLDEDSIRQELEPGVVDQLPPGFKFEGFDPQHPNSSAPSWLKHFLRRFAGVLPGVGYNAVANDLEGVNFSSLRHATLSERDAWKLEQGFFCDQVLEDLYPDWLTQALLGDKLTPLRFEDFDRLVVHSWQGRRWEWIDPLKEASGAKLDLENGTTTLSWLLAERGRTLREWAETVAEERDLLGEAGLEDVLPYGKKPETVAPASPPKKPDDDEPEEPDDDEEEDDEEDDA